MSEQVTEENTKNKVGIIFKILAIVYIAITILFFISVIKINLLPNTYITIIGIVQAIITIIISIGLAKKHKTYTLNIVCLVIAVLISSSYIYTYKYTNATTQFLDNIFTQIEETDEYYIVVKNDSNYNSIQNLSKKDVYTFKIENDIKEKVLSEANVNFKEDESLTQIGNDLLNNKIEAILVSSSQHSILSEEIKNFKQNTKIIYTSTQKILQISNLQEDDDNYNMENGVFNVYISGIDTKGTITNVSRSDANLIVTVNTKTHEVLLTSIPRDYYVTLHSKKAKDKLTHSGIYGVNETVNTVEDLLDIDIDYYVRVNFTTVVKLIDTLDGINVYSEYDFTSADGYHFNKGNNYVNGEQALSFSRERHSFASGDNQRVKNQQLVIQGVINKVLESNTILTKYTEILNSLEGSFQTNINQKDISSLVKKQIQTMPSWQIRTNSLTGYDSQATTYSAGKQKLYVMLPDETSVQNAKNQIKNVMEK